MKSVKQETAYTKETFSDAATKLLCRAYKRQIKAGQPADFLQTPQKEFIATYQEMVIQGHERGEFIDLHFSEGTNKIHLQLDKDTLTAEVDNKSYDEVSDLDYSYLIDCLAGLNGALATKHVQVRYNEKSAPVFY